MKLGIGSFNVGPDKMLGYVAQEAAARGHDTVRLQAQEPHMEHHAAELADADAVILGFSTEQDEETALIRALPLNVPVFLVEDIPKIAATKTPKLLEIAPRIRSVLTAMPGYEDELAAFGYDANAAVHAGPPPHWIGDINAMHDGERIRKNGGLLKVKWDEPGEAEPAEHNANILYLSGSKNIAAEIGLMRELIATATETYGEGNFIVHYRGHPGERIEFEKRGGAREFADLHAEMLHILAGQWRIGNDEMNAPQEPHLRATADAKAIGAADTIYVHPGATSLNWMGYGQKNALAVMGLVKPSQLGEYDYEFVASRVAMLAHRMQEVRTLTELLMSEAGARELHERQCRNLGLHEGTEPDMRTAPRILDVIERRM